MAEDFYVYTNADKDHWQKNEDAKTCKGIRRGSRTLVVAQPNLGKTNLMFNLVNNSVPCYQRIYIFRNKNSKEYGKIVHEFIENISDLPIEEIETCGKKILIIMEDLDKLNKNELKIVDHVMRYLCSHCGVSAVIVCQSFYSIENKLRLKLDILHFFPQTCNMSHLLLKSPIDLDERQRLIQYIRNNRKDLHDFVTIDFSQQQKYKMNMKPINIGFEQNIPETDRVFETSKTIKKKNKK